MSLEEGYKIFDHIDENLDQLFEIKRLINSKDNKYFHVTTLNNILTPLVSVVMTSYNRSQQTYFTLKTISKSNVSGKIQVIIVDDSTHDPLDCNEMCKYNMCIYHIRVDNERKFWTNPCVNYNLGFQYIKGSITIIQNAEVCHIGDICHFLCTQPIFKQYYVFDVANMRDLECNTRLSELGAVYSNYNKIVQLFGNYWMQQYGGRNNQYHFLVATDTSIIRKIGGFDLDYALGIAYDDDELIFKLRRFPGAPAIINIPHTYGFFGIHQWHIRSEDDWWKGKLLNNKLFRSKAIYHDKNAKFIYLTEGTREEANDKIKILKGLIDK